MTAPGEVLRIAFDHQIFVRQSYGGVSRYFCEIARRIARLPRFDVKVVAPLHSNQHLRRSPVATLGMFVPRAAGLSRLQSAVGRAAWPALRGAAAPHVVHQTYYDGHERSRGRPRVVVTVHDMTQERLPQFFGPSDDTTRRKRAAVAAADHVICVSENTRRDLLECFGVAAERTTVIHHGCDAAGLRAAAAAATPSRPFVLHVGPRGGYKNFDRLLEAFASSPALRREFDLVAFGGGAWSARERARVRELGLRAERVRRVTGSDEVLAGLYASASALVLPSLYEGFGIPLVEAMSFGCPVACSAAGSLPEIAADAACYFDPRDAQALREALESVLGSPALQQRLRAAGRARAASFSWEATAAQTAALYARVAGA
jgi:glycosyltransferase involved in cell wall biosynthesis